ncbi:MAG TPA: NAD(P)H-binding protein [Spirochaetota bacterium]|nr:NAD(P)H-binding protein [Spirochaetota bacterium]
MKAVIIGATGLTGSLLIEKISSDRRFDEIIAFVRKIPEKRGNSLILKTISFNEIEKEKFKADAAFTCLGTTIKTAGSREKFREVDLTYNLSFARACRKNGVNRFILLSSLGADPSSGIFYNRIKGELEEAITALDFEYLSIIRPSLLEGPRGEWRTGEFIARKLMKVFNPLLVGTLRKYRSVSIDALTKVMINEAFREEPGVKIIENDKILSSGRS